jgi:hypothetical protein
MKIKILKHSIPLLLAAAVLVLSGYSDGSDEKNGGARATSISVAGVSVTTVPGAVSRAEWTGEDFSLFGLEPAAGAIINDAASLARAKIVVAERWGKGKEDIV